MFTARFWKDAGERSIRASVAAVVGALGSNVVGLLDVDVPSTLSVAGLAALMSLLNSVLASGAGDEGTAGFVSLRRGADSIHRM